MDRPLLPANRFDALNGAFSRRLGVCLFAGFLAAADLFCSTLLVACWRVICLTRSKLASQLALIYGREQSAPNGSRDSLEPYRLYGVQTVCHTVCGRAEAAMDEQRSDIGHQCQAGEAATAGVQPLVARSIGRSAKVWPRRRPNGVLYWAVVVAFPAANLRPLAAEWPQRTLCSIQQQSARALHETP